MDSSFLSPLLDGLARAVLTLIIIASLVGGAIGIGIEHLIIWIYHHNVHVVVTAK